MALFKSVSVTNPKGAELVMELDKPELSGFAITNVEGVSPEESTVNITELATVDGGVFNTARKSVRDITITMAMYKPNVGNLSVEELRHKLYEYFPIKKKVTLKFTTTDRVLYAECYVESNSVIVFTDMEYTQITLRHPNVWFEGEYETQIITGSGSTNLVYDGDTTGYLLATYEITTLSGVTGQNLIIANTTTSEIMKIDLGKVATYSGLTLAVGDEISISTKPGNKSIYLIRGAAEYVVLGALAHGESSWITTINGTNTLTVNLSGKTTLTTRNLYEGV